MFKKNKLGLLILLLFIITTGFILYFSRSRFENQADIETTITRANNAERARTLTNQLLTINRNILSNADKPSLTQIASLTSLAAQRKTAMSALIEENPEEFIKNSIPSNLKDMLDNQVQAYIEKPVQLIGEVSIFGADNFRTGKSSVKYLLKNSAQNGYELYFVNKPKNLLPHAKISISGITLDNKIAIDATPSDNNLQILSKPSSAITKQFLTNDNTAVVFFNFQNNASYKPDLIPIVKEALFTGTTSMRKFYEEASYNILTLQGKKNIDGDYYGWYTVPNGNTACSLDDVDDWLYALGTELDRAGVKYSDYRHYIFIFPDTPACEWLGLGEIGGTLTFVNGGYSGSNNRLMHVASHELGHNYLFGHANFLSCQDAAKQPVSSGGDCSVIEYNDPFDIMGNINIRHPNTIFKGNHVIYPIYGDLLGVDWLGSANINKVTASGTYSLAPMEQLSVLPQLILIPKEYDSENNALSYFALEYRQPYGFDNGTASDSLYNGVTIRVVNTNLDYYTYFGTMLIDTSPGTPNTQSALTAGQTFSDADSQVSISDVEVDPQTPKVDFKITIGTNTCQYNEPTVTLTPSYTQALMPGTIKSFSFTAKNENSAGCGTQKFNLNYLADFTPTDWQITVNPASTNLTSGQTVTGTLTIKSPSDAPDAYYSVAATAGNPSKPYLIGMDIVSYRIDRAISMIPTGKINIADAPVTSIAWPTLYFSAPVSAKVRSYRLSNNGSKWSSWHYLLLAEQKTGQWKDTYWRLTDTFYGGNSKEGTKKVYVQFRNSAERISKIYKDSVIYSPRKIFPLKITRSDFKSTKQFIKIKNRLRGSIKLDGFILKNSQGQKAVIKKFTLKAGKSVTIYARKGSTSSKKGRLYMGKNRRFWKKSHDYFLLYCNDNQLVLSKKY